MPSEPGEPNEARDRAALDEFLANNPELEDLSARLAKFNVFRALRVEDVEIRHSNALAWLLDPNESHGLGALVLRRVLSNMLLESETDIEGISAARVELMDFSDIEVRREWAHVDILVVDHRNNLLIPIENKVHSGEGAGQLARYKETAAREFPGFLMVPVFLTLEGQQSDDENATAWISYSHGQLLKVLERLIGQRKGQLSEAVAVFLEHYTDTLRRLTMQDDDLAKLCKEIYRRHREAIDLIVEYGRVSRFQDVVAEVLSQGDRYEILCSRPDCVRFLPRAWPVPEKGDPRSWVPLSRPVAVYCYLSQLEKTISCVFEVNPMKDRDLRMACVRALKEAGFKLSQRAFRPEAEWSRFFSASQKVSDLQDDREVQKAVEKLLSNAEALIPKATAVFEAVFKEA